MAESVCGQTDRTTERQTGKLADRKIMLAEAVRHEKRLKSEKIKLIFENILLKVKKIKNM